MVDALALASLHLRKRFNNVGKFLLQQHPIEYMRTLADTTLGGLD
jgi:hypothetical protein